jgi:hypothetical protein
VPTILQEVTGRHPLEVAEALSVTAYLAHLEFGVT